MATEQYGENLFLRALTNFSGDKFPRTVIWEFPSFEKAIECHDSIEYQEGWSLAKDTTERHLQISQGFNIE